MSNYLIKIGGQVLENHDLFRLLLTDIQNILKDSHHCVLVHGGGLRISEYCKQHQIAPQFDAQGRRITNEQEMKISDMVLGGTINNEIVRACTALTINAVGLSSADHGLITGKAINNTFTGSITHCDTKIIELLTSHEIVPVINSIACDTHGNPLNINADEVAQMIAQTWPAENLLLLSNVPGIVCQGDTIPILTKKDIENYTRKGVISGGMITKTQNSLEALKYGVRSVIIGEYLALGDLTKLATHKKGSCIIL